MKSVNHFALKTLLANSEFRVPGNWPGLLVATIGRVSPDKIADKGCGLLGLLSLL